LFGLKSALSEVAEVQQSRMILSNRF
jgi:hypothetical protein